MDHNNTWKSQLYWSKIKLEAETGLHTVCYDDCNNTDIISRSLN